MKFSRQQLLLGILVIFGLLNVGDWAITSMIQAPLQERRDRTEALMAGIQKRQALLKATREAGKKIAVWKKQSLPANTAVAEALYRSWLLRHVEDCGLFGSTVNFTSVSTRRGLYSTLPFSVRGRGTLEQFTDLMFRITDSGHLHRVKDISLSPSGDGVVDISLSIEALIVAGTKRTDRLASVKGRLLASPEVSDYAVISRQNLFGLGYRDPLAAARVTAITWKNGRPRIWISDKADDSVCLKVGLNEELAISGFRGRVIAATDEDVTLESGAIRLVVSLGQTLADARPVSE